MRGKGQNKNFEFQLYKRLISFRKIWYLENHRNLVKRYPNLLTTNVKRAGNILENTSKIIKVNMKSICGGKWITPFFHIIKI